MRTFLWLVLLGAVVYFMHRRAREYGYPWEDQVVLTHVDAGTRYRGGSEQMIVQGEVRNRTLKAVTAEITCTSLPQGMTLTPKATQSVELQPQEGRPFEIGLTSRRTATGADCEVSSWNAGGGLEEKLVRGVRRQFDRIRHAF